MDVHGNRCGTELGAVSIWAMYMYGPRAESSSSGREGPSRGGSGALDGRACRCGHGGIALSHDKTSSTVLSTVVNKHDHPRDLHRITRRNYRSINMMNKPPDIRTTSPGIGNARSRSRWATRISWIIILLCIASCSLGTEGLFVNVPESVNASAGEPVTIPCTYVDEKQDDVLASPSVRWTRALGNEHSEILTKTGSSIKGPWYVEGRATVVGQASLLMFAVSSQDAGKYTCTVGETQGTTELFVDGTPKIQPELRELVLEAGRPLELDCQGEGALEWRWPRHDEQHITFLRRHDPSSSWQTSELRIQQTSPRDAGEYRCVSSEGGDSDKTWSSEPVYVYVTRENGSLFLETNQTDLVHFWNQPFLVPCRLATPNAIVTLERFDPTVVTYDPWRGFTLRAGLPDYSGNVSCHAVLGNRTDVQSFTVAHVVKPKLSIEGLEEINPEETISEYSELVLICSGIRPLRWFTPSSLGARLQIVHMLSHAPSQPPSYTSTLRLNNTRYTDTGEYACKYERYVEFEQPEVKSSVYVFVKSEDETHFFLPTFNDLIFLESDNQSFTVPCRVSNPNETQPVRLQVFYTVTFKEVAEFTLTWHVTFDPKVGFRISPTSASKSFRKLTFTCKSELIENAPLVQFRVIVKGTQEDYFQSTIEPSTNRLVQGTGPYSLTCKVSIPILTYPRWILDYKPRVEFMFSNQDQDTVQNNTELVNFRVTKFPFIIFGSTLNLHQVSLRNSGTFKCTISNIEFFVKMNTSLLVLEEGIVELTHYPPDEEIVEAVKGQSEVCLRARMQSIPDAQYRWSKNGVNQTDETAPRFVVREESELEGDARLISGCVANLTVEDGGSYDLIAANAYHTRMLLIQLSVLEIPEVSLTVMPNPIYRDPPLYYTEQNYSLVCRARGRPAPIITWQWQSCADPLCDSQAREDQWGAVETQPWAHARDQPASEPERSSVSVLSVWRPTQSGVFRCKGRSPSDRIPDVAYDVLEYRLSDLMFSLPAVPELMPVYTYGQASLVCKTNVYAFAEDVWWDWTPAVNSSLRPDPIGPDDERVGQLGRTGYHHSTELTIGVALANDTGLYRCTAQKRSNGENVVVYEVQLNVKEIVQPTFTKKLQPTYTLDKKKPVPYGFVLECEATGDPLPDNVDWSRDGSPLTVQNGSVKDLETFRNLNDTLVSRLILEPEITPAHGGTYSCSVRNNGGLTSTRGQVLLQASPTAVIVEDVYTCKAGDNLTIPCDTTGTPSPEIVWTKLPRGASVLEDVPASMYDNNARALVFKRLLETDNGEYTCIARNLHGDAQDATTVVIHMKSSYLVPLIVGSSIAGIIFLILLILMIAMAKRNCRLVRKAQRNSEGMELGLVNPRSPRLPMSPFRMSFKEEFGDQLPFDSKWEFPRDRLKLGSVIGQGAFGMVLKGVAAGINKNEKYVPVAVKTVKSDASYVDRKALFGELKMLIQVGHHLNVVNFLGACTQDSPPLVIVEFCPYGNLSEYLRSKRDTFQTVRSPAPSTKSEQEENTENELNYADLMLRETCVSEPPAVEYELVDKEAKRMAEKSLTVEDLVCFCFQVARGMEFLASRKCIHRDMAARNVLLGGNNVVKICDFGLSRSFYHDTDYIGSGKGLLPIKWMAPEAIFDKIYTTYSDIWSFGVFTWEVFSLGGSPYPGIQVDERFYTKMKSGYRMSCPDHAPREVYQLMLECWSVEPKDRPMFSELAEHFGELLESNTRQEYIDLNIPYQEGQYCELDFGKLSINQKPETVVEETETMQPPSDDMTADDAAATDHFHDPTYQKGPRNYAGGHADKTEPTDSCQPLPLPRNDSRPSSTEVIGETCPLHKYAAIRKLSETQEKSQSSGEPEVQFPDSLPEDPYRRGSDEQLHTYMSVKGARPGALSADKPPANGVVPGSDESKLDNLPSPDDSNKLHMYASIRGSRPDTLSSTDLDKGLDRNHLYSSIKGSRPNTTPDVTPEVKGQGEPFNLPEEELSLLGKPKLPERDLQSMSLGRSLDGKLQAQKPLLPKRDFSTTSWSPERETLLDADAQDADAQMHTVYV